MNIVYVLIPLSLVLLCVAIWAFFWAVDNGQFDEMDKAAQDIFTEDSSQTTSKQNDI